MNSLQAAEPYFSKAWLNLIHYQKSFSGYKSEIDGAGFFLSSDGKTNPKKEFEATLIALNDTTKLYGHLKQPAACIFVSRKLWLESIGHRFPKVECREYENWRKALPVSKVHLVFASAYPNNPASMFGHTFLRLSGSGEGNDLLDYIINFAATTDQDGGIEFALFGVFGGYEGHYSLAPYFIKVNEYNHVEARDLWEYPLTLSASAIDRLLAHLWEIEATTYFDYYFFDENCSWQIIRLLEAADENLNLSEQLPFYIVPAQTVRVLNDHQLLGEPIFRSSLWRLYEAYPEESDEKKLLYYRIKERIGKLDEKEKATYHTLLTNKAKSKKVEETPKVAIPENRPDFGHGLGRIGASVGDGYYRLTHRFVLHDLLDQDVGHEKWSQLEALETVIEYDDRIFLREFNLVDVISLHDNSDWGFEPSWFLKVGLQTPQEFKCTRCLTAAFLGGLGQTVFFSNKTFFLSAHAALRAYGHSPDGASQWLGAGARVMGGYNYEKFKALIDVQKYWSPQFHSEVEARFSLSYGTSKDTSVRGLVAEDRAELSFYYYY